MNKRFNPQDYTNSVTADVMKLFYDDIDLKNYIIKYLQLNMIKTPNDFRKHIGKWLKDNWTLGFRNSLFLQSNDINWNEIKKELLINTNESLNSIRAHKKDEHQAIILIKKIAGLFHRNPEPLLTEFLNLLLEDIENVMIENYRLKYYANDKLIEVNFSKDIQQFGDVKIILYKYDDKYEFENVCYMDLNTQQRQIFEKILNSNMIKIVKENLNDNIRKWANKVKQEAEPFVNKSVSYITENAFNGYEAIHSILEYDGDDMEVLDVKDLNVLMEAMKILRKLELKYSDENHTLKRAFPNSNKIIK